MQKAYEALSGKWGLAVGTFFIYILILGGIQVVPIVGSIAALIIAGPMALGLVIFTLSISRNKEAKLGQIFEGFDNFGTSLGAYLLMLVFIILWMLLLIVPGIIAAISYSQTFFIIADDNTIGADEAIDKSKAMMDGYKVKYFLLCLRFIGWILLCILTLGIGFLWLMPYMYVTFANFYDDIKD